MGLLMDIVFSGQKLFMKLALILHQESIFASGSTPMFFARLGNEMKGGDDIGNAQSVIVSNPIC